MFFAKKLAYFSVLGFLFFAPSFARPKHNILPHITMVQALKEHFARTIQKIETPTFTDATPTLSYLDAVKRNKVIGWFFGGSNVAEKEIEKYKKEYGDIIDLAIERERRYCSDYYVFYHGLPNSFHIFHDILKELHTLMAISRHPQQFEFFRMWHEAEKQIKIKKYMDDEEGGSLGAHWWSDFSPHLAKTLISVNLSLFGNLFNSSSHSFGYFKDNSKVNIGFTEKLLKELFKHFGFDASYVSHLIALNEKFKTSEGMLLQIFIPKDKVDDYVYLSQAGGTPYRTVIDDKIYDNKRNRHMKIAPLLDQYIKDPTGMGDFDNFQARMLCSQDFMLNPEGGVKIFKYTTMKESDSKKYHKELKRITGDIFTDWLSAESYKNIEKTSLGRLIDYMR